VLSVGYGHYPASHVKLFWSTVDMSSILSPAMCAWIVQYRQILRSFFVLPILYGFIPMGENLARIVLIVLPLDFHLPYAETRCHFDPWKSESMTEWWNERWNRSIQKRFFKKLFIMASRRLEKRLHRSAVRWFIAALVSFTASSLWHAMPIWSSLNCFPLRVLYYQITVPLVHTVAWLPLLSFGQIDFKSQYSFELSQSRVLQRPDLDDVVHPHCWYYGAIMYMFFMVHFAILLFEGACRQLVQRTASRMVPGPSKKWLGRFWVWAVMLATAWMVADPIFAVSGYE
jgi:hypothetical protein